MRRHTPRPLASRRTILALALVLAAAPGLAWEGAGGGLEALSGREFFVDLAFRLDREPGPRAHGMVIGTRRVGPNGAVVMGPSLALRMSRAGRLRCAAPATVTVSDGCIHLDGASCGLPTDAYCDSGGGEGGPPFRHAAAGLTRARAARTSPGRLVQRGALSCVVVSNAELLRLDPGAEGTDVVACHYPHAGIPVHVWKFTNGALGRECYGRLDPATHCAAADADCELPDLPLCFR